jgi:hypothetical protein
MHLAVCCLVAGLLLASIPLPSVAASDQNQPFVDRFFGKKANFDQLRRDRRKILSEIAALEREVKTAENQVEVLNRNAERITFDQRMLESQMRQIDVELSLWKLDPKSPNTDSRYVRNKLPTAEDTPFSGLSYELIKSRKSDLEQRIKSITERTLQAAQLVEANKRRQIDIRQKEAALIEVEELIGNEIGMGANQYIYRTIVSLIFAGIVAYLVYKFFKTIEQNEKVKESIFSGEAGIQFITLFSIVIAVILFGILEILGSNELSALLGGLSGYILGKVGPRPQQSPAQELIPPRAA